MIEFSSRSDASRLKNSAKAFMIISLFIVSMALIIKTPVYSIVPNANLTEWTVPTANSVPLGLSLDPAGHCCWFVEFSGNKVAHLDPSTNTFQEWDIPTAGANPLGIATTTISDSLAIWGTEFAKDKVFVFYPSSGTFLEYSLPNANSGVEYTSVEPSASFVSVWFTEVQRDANGELIYDPHTGTGTLYEDRFPDAVGGGANGIFAGPGVVWYAGFSSLVRWDRTTNQYTIWPLPTHGTATGRFLAFDSHGQPWYTQGVLDAGGNDNYVGVLRGDNTIKEWQIPTAGSDPRMISISPFTQNPWIAEQSSQANNGQVTALDPSAGGNVVPSTPTTAPSSASQTTLTPLTPPPSIASSNIMTPVTTPMLGTTTGQFTDYPLGSSLPHDVIVDSSGNTWVIESSANKIARITAITPDFGLSTPSGTVSIPEGSSGEIAITGTSITGYSGTITLAVTSAPSGVSFSSFTPNPINIPSGGTVSAALTISVAPSAPTGQVSVTISGTDGTLTHNTTFTLLVTPAADFSLALSGGSLTIGPGSSTTDGVTITSLGGFSTAVNLTTGALPSGVHVTFSPTSVTLPSGSTATSTATLTVDSETPSAMTLVAIIGTSGSLSHSELLDITITPAIAPDFTLSANPPSILISQGSSGTSTVYVGSENGFNSAVGLSFSWMGSAPSGLSVSLPGPVTPPSGSSATSTLTVSADSASSTGSFTLIVTGTSGSLTHSANVGVLINAAVTSTTTSIPSSPKCLIATATYGSELSPEVQLLRNFRDNSIQRTKAGSSFMLVFNAWYYSFSPYVAGYLTSHAAPRSLMKVILYPIIAILFVASGLFSVTSSYPELAVLLSGLQASALIGALYLGLPLILIRSKLRSRRNGITTKLLAITLLSGIATLSVGEALTSSILLMVSSPMIVISTMLLSGITISRVISERLLKHNSY